MNEDHREFISIGLTVGIVAFALFIIHRFIPSLIWAGIIVIATYPLYRQWRRLFGARDNLSALLFTLIMVLLLILPLSWLISVLVGELQLFINYLQLVNREGDRRRNLFGSCLLWVIICSHTGIKILATPVM